MATYEMISINDVDDVELDEVSYLMSDEDREQFLKEAQDLNKQLSILCCGPTGAGKSTLLNGLMGEARWSGEFLVGTSLQRGTTKVEEIVFVKKGVKVTLWDTPGLEGGENDGRYLQEIKEKCGNFDLFLYCIDCTEHRATDLFGEKSSLKNFTELFGAKKLWGNAVVVLAQANGIVADLEEQKEEIDVEAKFECKISEWKNEIHQRLKSLGYAKAWQVPVMPAGVKYSPKLLPRYPLWLSNIFEKVVDKMKYEARQAYLLLQDDRIKENGDELDLESISSLDIDAQPFVIKPKFKMFAAVASTGVGLGAAAAGAAVGALALGVPSFGVFAIGGLFLGGVVGGGVGLVVSGATMLGAKYFMKRKHERGAYEVLH